MKFDAFRRFTPWILAISLAAEGALAAPSPAPSPWMPPWLSADALRSGLAPEQPYLEDGEEIAVQGLGIEVFFETGGWIEARGGRRLYGAALLIDGERVEGLAYRAYDARGRLIGHGPVEITWSEGIAHVGDIRLSRPAARIALLRGGAAIDYLRIEPITEPRAPRRVLARELPLEREAAIPKNVVPGFVVTRAEWGARATGACGSSHSPRYLTVHHTATPNNDSLSPAARMRQMQAYHIDTLGWCDLGYHFVVGIDGKVYEGRPHARTGAHVGNWNTNNLGVSVVGTFVGFEPRQSQRDGLTDIARWLVERYGIPKNRSAILGHKEWPGHESNSCPGLLLPWLPTLVQRISQPNTPPPPPATVLDGFEQGVGRFTRDPNWSGSTVGISSQSFAQRSNLQAKSGEWSLQVMLRDDPNSGADWFVRLLSGDGNPANNARLAKPGGRLGAWFFTAASGVRVRFLVDDSDGTEISNAVTLPQNQWLYVQVKLDDQAQWSPWAGGNGTITASEVTLDAIVFERAQTSWDVYLYVDDVQYRRE
ncbi:MAG: peptidoglycan recognition family protein [Xanthomonadales bacterium]|nr:peptidoglycan recognition family protein [Xanthomonadales bacterium]